MHDLHVTHVCPVLARYRLNISPRHMGDAFSCKLDLCVLLETMIVVVLGWSNGRDG
jgi:hypothetical protein